MGRLLNRLAGVFAFPGTGENRLARTLALPGALELEHGPGVGQGDQGAVAVVEVADVGIVELPVVLDEERGGGGVALDNLPGLRLMGCGWHRWWTEIDL